MCCCGFIAVWILSDVGLVQGTGMPQAKGMQLDLLLKMKKMGKRPWVILRT